MPDGGLPLYRLSIPSGNDGDSDPYLSQVTMTDLRRVEAGTAGHWAEAARRPGGTITRRRVFPI